MAATTRPDAHPRRLGRAPRLPLVALATLGLLGLTGCDLPSGFHDYVVFDGLIRPTSVEFSSDGRVFVTEKRGVVKVFDGVDDTSATVVADLRTNTYNSWDRGMLGPRSTPTSRRCPTSSWPTPTTPCRAALRRTGASPTPTTTCARLLRVRPPTAAW